MTRIAGESGPCSAWVMRSAATTPGSAGGVGEDHALGGAGGQVDADLAADLDLGGGDPGVARPDDPVDGLDAGVRQAEGEGRDRLGATGDDEGIDFEQAGGAERGPGRRAPSRSAGEATTIRSTPATWAGTTVITSDEG